MEMVVSIIDAIKERVALPQSVSMDSLPKEVAIIKGFDTDSVLRFTEYVPYFEIASPGKRRFYPECDLVIKKAPFSFDFEYITVSVDDFRNVRVNLDYIVNIKKGRNITMAWKDKDGLLCVSFT
jgi:hypothetical protein